MTDAQPLRGLRYAREKVGNLADVITPPFDVISKDAQASYYARSPYNIIRLELGQAHPDDTVLDNVYTRAAATSSEWRQQGILQQDARACYYLYRQSFVYGEQYYTRTSLLARVRLESWDARVILPHEHTRKKDKEDRLQLLHACACNFSPIMCMYDDPQGRLRRLLNTYTDQPEVRVVDEVGEEHLLQPIIDSEQIAFIQDFFAGRQLYIADGHHRYTTALQYRDEMLAQRHELHPMDASNFVLMALIDIDDPGMLMLPTHRILSALSEDVLNRLKPEHFAEHFAVHILDAAESANVHLEQLALTGQQGSSLLIKTKDHTLLLSINERGRKQMEGSGHSAAWNVLDVAILQSLVLENLLGITAEDVADGKYVRYTHDTEQTLQALESGEAQAIILLNGIPFRQVRDVAQADDRMPQKSTYLYPKLITGLVINPLW